jgi:nucleoside phosphorylase
MNIYLFPTELEAAKFREQVPEAEVVISGVGEAAIAATLARVVPKHRHDVCYILAGIAGAYGDAVAVGEVVEVLSERCAELPTRFIEEYRNVPRTTLLGVRSNTVSRGDRELQGAEIENMEGAAFFAMAEAMGLRVMQIRAISNRVGEAFERWCINEALEALAVALKKIEKGE